MSGQTNCQELIHRYIEYISKESILSKYGVDGCRIITPYWRPDGDHIEIFTTPTTNDSILVTDEGQTYDWLFSIGIDIDTSETRQELINNLTERYGITLKDGVLSLELEAQDIGFGLHRFLTTLRGISQLGLMRRQRGRPTFREEVELFFVENNQNYSTNFKIKGKTLEHTVDFHLNSGRNLLVGTLTASSASNAKNKVKLIAFQWIDIREGGWDYQMVTVIDDSAEKWENIWSKPRIREPLENYSDHVIRWSQKVSLLGPLASD